MDARACMHSYCSALPPSQASSLLMLHVHVQKRPFSRPSIAENKNLALTCAPVSPHGAAGHKNQRRVLVWLFRSPPPPCQVSSRIGYGSCAASTVPLHSWRSWFFLGHNCARHTLWWTEQDWQRCAPRMDRKHVQGKIPPRALFFTLKVLVEALLILPVIIQVQFKSLRQYF